MLSQMQHISNLGQKRTKMNLSKYKEEQEMVIGRFRRRNRNLWRPPETRLSSRVAVAAQPINKRILDWSEHAHQSERQLKCTFFTFPYSSSAILALMLSSL